MACELLVEDRLEDTFKVGKCYYILDHYLKQEMGKAVHRHWESFLNRQDDEDIDSEKLIQVLRRKKQKNKTVPAWYLRIQFTARGAIRDRLRSMHLIPREEICGTCAFRAERKPHECNQSLLMDVDSASMIPNPLYGTPRNRDDLVCDSYEPRKALREWHETSRPNEGLIGERVSDFGVIERAWVEVSVLGRRFDALKQRYEIVKNKATRRIRRRQYFVYLNVWELRLKGGDEKTAKAELLKELEDDPSTREARRRQMDRDLEKAKKYLKSRGLM